MENKIVYPNMETFFKEMKKLLDAEPNKRWDTWESMRLLQLGFRREDGLIVAYRISSIRKYYQMQRFSSEAEAIEQYKQDLRDLFGIKRELKDLN